MLELVKPTARLMAQWQDAHAEWGPGNHEDGFGLLPTDEVSTPEGFEAWIDRLETYNEHCSCWWIADGDRVLGGIALRHDSHPRVERLGHVGYGVRPSARGRGIASWAMTQIVAAASSRGIKDLLVICEAGNQASAATIESVPGVRREEPSGQHESTWRYRVSTGA